MVPAFCRSTVIHALPERSAKKNAFELTLFQLQNWPQRLPLCHWRQSDRTIGKTLFWSGIFVVVKNVCMHVWEREAVERSRVMFTALVLQQSSPMILFSRVAMYRIWWFLFQFCSYDIVLPWLFKRFPVLRDIPFHFYRVKHRNMQPSLIIGDSFVYIQSLTAVKVHKLERWTSWRLKTELWCLFWHLLIPFGTLFSLTGLAWNHHPSVRLSPYL